MSISVECYDEEKAENYRICCVVEKCIRHRSQILVAQIEDLNEDCVKFRLSIQFIVLIDSASPKTDTKMYFNF